MASPFVPKFPSADEFERLYLAHPVDDGVRDGLPDERYEGVTAAAERAYAKLVEEKRAARELKVVRLAGEPTFTHEHYKSAADIADGMFTKSKADELREMLKKMEREKGPFVRVGETPHTAAERVFGPIPERPPKLLRCKEGSKVDLETFHDNVWKGEGAMGLKFLDVIDQRSEGCGVRTDSETRFDSAIKAGRAFETKDELRLAGWGIEIRSLTSKLVVYVATSDRADREFWETQAAIDALKEEKK